MATNTSAIRRPSDAVRGDRKEQKLVRLSVNMNEETAQALTNLAERGNISYTEAVRRAIALCEFLESEKSAGRVILTADKDRDNVRELVIM